MWSQNKDHKKADACMCNMWQFFDESRVPAMAAVQFPADLRPLYVSELSETLPTCVCFRHEELGRFFWALPFFFDSVMQAIGDDGNASNIQKFNQSVQKLLGQGDVQAQVGNNSFYFNARDPQRQCYAFQAMGPYYFLCFSTMVMRQWFSVCMPWLSFENLTDRI